MENETDSMRFLKDAVDPVALSPLTLAFIGDCVYELFVREALVTEANRPAGKGLPFYRRFFNRKRIQYL